MGTTLCPYRIAYRGDYVTYFLVIHGIALNPGVYLASVKFATRQLYTRHRGTDWTRFYCELNRASAVRNNAQAKEGLCRLDDKTTLPPVQNKALK